MPGGRVLMIAHHFPPAGGSGSNRALAFARYLPAFGWRPTVLTPGAAWAANRDDRLLAEVPPHVRVVRTRSLEPAPARVRSRSLVPREDAPEPSSASVGRVRRQLGHLRRFPDAHIGWLPFALAAARRETYDVVYSSSGPFTSHVIGLALKRLDGRPWVAELRDGWYRWNRAIFPDYPIWRDALERRLEAVAIRSADRVVLVTERMAAAFRTQYAHLPEGHFAVVPNGFDPSQFRFADGEPSPFGSVSGEPSPLRFAGGESSPFGLGGGEPSPFEFASGEPLPSGSVDGEPSRFHFAGGEPSPFGYRDREPSRRDSDGQWVLLHAGALYYGRSLALFLAAARRLAEADAEFRRDFRLRLVGTLDAAARAELAQSGLGGAVEVVEQMPHAAAIVSMRAADALLLVANTTPGAEATVPGKLFEYLAVGRPVLAVAPAESSTADVLRQTGGGWLADAADLEAITGALRRAYRERYAPPAAAGLAAFDRRRLSGDLAAVFESVRRAGRQA